MISNQVWTPVNKEKVITDAKILTSIWKMKEKANGQVCARINARGYKQEIGVRFQENERNHN